MSFSNDPALQSDQLSLSLDIPEPDNRDFLDIISLLFKRIVSGINTKEGALYPYDETATFKRFFFPTDPLTYRNVYRKTFDMIFLNGGNIPAGATVIFPHGITGLFNTALIYASVTTVDSRFFTVVWPNVFLNATNVNFTNPASTDASQVTVVAEYLKN